MSIDTKGNVAIQGSAGEGVTGGSFGLPVNGIPIVIGGDFNIIPDSTQNKTYFGNCYRYRR